MIIVTGGAGFIGSNIVKGLNEQGYTDILIVDDLTDGHKFKNIADLTFLDYVDKDDFLANIKDNVAFSQRVEAVFHQGACVNTTEWDGKYMLSNNYEYSKALLHYCLEYHIQFIYASSAAVYGSNNTFIESPEYEQPINIYGYSKLLFDRYVRRLLPEAQSQIVGLRYFNVYGPREQHKGSMASVIFHLNQQLKTHGKIKLFGGNHGYADGEQRRDFIYIDDVVDVNLWFLVHREISNIFNCGTGRSEPFNHLAIAVLDWHQQGELEYIPFPKNLKGHYQSFTQANLDHLRAVGYSNEFKTVAQGTKAYLDALVQS